jgi:hypothetical protein
MALWIATIFAATVGQHAQQLNVMAIEQRDHPVIEKIGGRDRRLAVIELGASDLGIGIDEPNRPSLASAFQWTTC